MKNGGSFHSCVSLPEGNGDDTGIRMEYHDLTEASVLS